MFDFYEKFFKIFLLQLNVSDFKELFFDFLRIDCSPIAW